MISTLSRPSKENDNTSFKRSSISKHNTLPALLEICSVRAPIPGPISITAVSLSSEA